MIRLPRKLKTIFKEKVVKCCLFTHLKVRDRGKNREITRDLPSTDSVPRWPQCQD